MCVCVRKSVCVCVCMYVCVRVLPRYMRTTAEKAVMDITDVSIVNLK